MAYKKFQKRKRPFKKRGPKGSSLYDRAYGVYNIAKKAYRGVNYIRRLINVEKKFFDVSYGNTGVSSTGAVIPLSQIAQGDSYNTRDGNSVLCQSLQWRAELTANSTSAINVIRMLIFSDNENRSATPAVSDVLEDLTAPVISPLLHIVGTRFNVLCDKCFTLSNTGNSWKTMVKKFLRHNEHMKYISGTATDTREGNLYALFISDAGTNTPTIHFYSRIRYTDN